MSKTPPASERCAYVWPGDVCDAPREWHAAGRHAFVAPAPDGEMCPVCGHEKSACYFDAKDHEEIATLRARVAELERVIAEAPHATFCHYHDAMVCDCWKSKASVR